MASDPRARLGKHPIHPLLVVFPAGLWIFSLIAYLIFLAGGNPNWDIAAWYAVAAGIVGALLAAAAGLADLTALPPSRARTLGTYHMLANVAALVLFAVALGTRWGGGGRNLPLVLLLLGIGVLGVGAFLGNTLVYVHGVGVSEEGIERHIERARTARRGEQPGMGGQTPHPFPG